MREDIPPSEIAVGLDVGSSKVCAVAGRMLSNGKLEIVSVAKVTNLGVQDGTIANIDHTAQAIQQVLTQIERETGAPVQRLVTNINGPKVLLEQKTTNYVSRSDERMITYQDVMQLEENIKRQSLPATYQSFSVLPRFFTVDNSASLYYPVGVPGSNLVGSYNVMSTPVDYQVNLKKALKKAYPQAQHTQFHANAVASSLAVLDDDEMANGVALVEFGADTINVAVWKSRVLLYHFYLRAGGHIVTQDIVQGCSISEEHAEILKCRHGNTLPEMVDPELFIEIPPKNNRPKRQVRALNLSQIIMCRMEELLEHIILRLEHEQVRDLLTDGMVLTGGVANLTGIKELTEAVTGLDVRIGLPTQHLGNIRNDQWKTPEHATAIGLTLSQFRKLDTRFKQFDQPTAQPERREPVQEQATRQTVAAKGKGWLSRISDLFTDDFVRDENS